MKIIEPKVELWLPKDNIKHVTKCARVFYNKNGADDDYMYHALHATKECRFFRHETHYFMIPLQSHVNDIIDTVIETDGGAPWFDWSYDLNGDLCVVTNGNWCLDNEYLYSRLKEYEVNMYQFEDLHLEEPNILEMMKYTFCFTTQISTSRELNQISQQNITESDIRTIDKEGVICRPHWIQQADCEMYMTTPYMTEYGTAAENAYANYIEYCIDSFKNFNKLIGCDVPLSYAVGILPLDTATNVVYTYSVYDWRRIIKKYKDKPNTKFLMQEVQRNLEELGYEFKED